MVNNRSFSQYENFNTTDNDYKQFDIYFDTRVQLAYRRRELYGLGIRLEHVSLQPVSKSQFDIYGRNNYVQPYLRYEFNTLNRLFLPSRGLYVLIEPSAILGQSQKLTVKSGGTQIPIDSSLHIPADNFLKLRAQIEYVIPCSKKAPLRCRPKAMRTLPAPNLYFRIMWWAAYSRYFVTRSLLQA